MRSRRMVAIAIILLIVVYSCAAVAFAVFFDYTAEAASSESTSNTTITSTAKIIEEDHVEETTTAPSVEEECIEPEPEPVVYVVQAGDSLWEIASEFYGNGAYYPYIIESNGLTDSSVIYEGDELIIEEIEDAEVVLEACMTFMSSVEEKKDTSSNTSNTTVYSNGSARNGIVPDGELEYLGEYRITGYDPYCVHCCGKANGVTASGTQATVGRTVGIRSGDLPYGTKIYIEGYGTYVIEDCGGGVKSHHIDIAASSHEECYTLTNSNVPVYLVK